MTEQLYFHFSLSCIGEANSNPLLCSCLENLRDGGAWWSAIYGFAQSRTRLKWLTSSSSSGKESSCQHRRCRILGFNPWVGKTPWSRKWKPVPVFLPGRFHGLRSLESYGPWGHKELDMTEHTHTHSMQDGNFVVIFVYSFCPSPYVELVLCFHYVNLLNIYFLKFLLVNHCSDSH